MAVFSKPDGTYELHFCGKVGNIRDNISIGKLEFTSDQTEKAGLTSTLRLKCTIPYEQGVAIIFGYISPHELAELIQPYFVTESPETTLCPLDGSVAIIDALRGEMVVNPCLETLDAYMCREDGSDLAGVRQSEIIDMGKTDYMPDGRGALCFADDIAKSGDFFEEIMSIAEKMCSYSLCISLRSAYKLGIDKFDEYIDAIFRAAVYGDVSVMLSGCTCAADIEYSNKIMSKTFCRLMGEGKEIDGYLARGIFVDSPIWLCGCELTDRADFLCFDFSNLSRRLLGTETPGELSDGENETLCRFWENYRATHRFGVQSELRAFGGDMGKTKIFRDWVEFMDIKEVYLPCRQTR